MNVTKEKVYTVKEIASEQNVSIQTVYRWCLEGYLQYFRRPSKKEKGGISISAVDYSTFKEIYRKNVE